MKILIVRPAATVVKRNAYNVQEEGIAKEYVRLGHECQLVFYTDSQKASSEKILGLDGKSYIIHWLPAHKVYDNAIFHGKTFRELIAWSDRIVTEEYEQLQSCILACKYPQKTVVYHGPYRCEYKARYQKKSQIFDMFFLHKMRKKKIHFAAKSDKAKETILEKGFQNVVTIPVGLDIGKFESISTDDVILKKSDSSVLKLLYVGVLEDRRNIPFLIETVSELKKQNVPVELDIYGNGEEDYVEQCKHLVKTSGLGKEISFHGSVSQAELPQIYLEHDVFMLPTKYEIYGMVLLEAMLFGRIVLTTDNGGSSVLVKHGENGFVLPEDDVKAWVKILTDISNKAVDVEAISASARETVDKQNGWKHSAEQFITLFKTMQVGKCDETRN